MSNSKAKNYFGSYMYSAYGGEFKPATFVCQTHPFITIKHYESLQDGKYECYLLSWQEISDEDFILYNKLNEI